MKLFGKMTSSSVKVLIKVRNYVMPLDETDSNKHDETGFCSKVSFGFLSGST